MLPLPILYHDDHLVAVNKPSGLLVHKSLIDRHETEYACRSCAISSGNGYIRCTAWTRQHRACWRFALDQETAKLMTGTITAGGVSKSYIAVVRGFTCESGRIDHALRVLRDKMTDLRADADKPAQGSVTEYQRLATIELPHPVGQYSTARFSLVRAMPLTGRTHQIRRHMKHVFHPVIGDTTYGDGRQNELFPDPVPLPQDAAACPRAFVQPSRDRCPCPYHCPAGRPFYHPARKARMGQRYSRLINPR